MHKGGQITLKGNAISRQPVVIDLSNDIMRTEQHRARVIRNLSNDGDNRATMSDQTSWFGQHDIHRVSTEYIG